MKRTWPLKTFPLSGLLLLALLCLPSGGLYGLERLGTEWGMGMRWIVNSHDVTASAPGPLLPSLSAGIRYELLPEKNVTFVPTVTLQGTNYLYDQDSDRAAPAEVEHRELWVLLPLFDFSLRWEFRQGADWNASAEGGIGLLLPVPVVPWRQGSIGEILPWMYGGGRFFYPTFGVRYEQAVTEDLAWSVKVKTGIPVLNILDSAAPFQDRLTLRLEFGIVFLRSPEESGS